MMLRMKRERLLKGYSGAELARRAQMNPSSVSQIENKKLSPYPSQVEKLVKALDWQGDPTELFEEVR